MVDTAEITVCGGNGGDGLITFGRAKFKPKGPPTGGSGGSGGDVYLVANSNVATLKDFVSRKIFEAPNGGAGGSNDRTGKCAEDLFIQVPVGTTVLNDKGQVIADLDSPKETFLAAKGGAGGRGNAHVAKSQSAGWRTNSRFQLNLPPTLISYTGKKFSKEKYIYYAERGKSGQRATFTLELKLIADVGLIGLPNAGKSSILNALTKTTKATVGSYPFTTLELNLGVMENVVMADVPGIIEGAHKGRGLGYKFLKHIERTKLLVHIISIEQISLNVKSITKTQAYKTIREELYNWNIALIEKPEIIAINKIDLEKSMKAYEKVFRNVIFVSAETGEGLAELKEKIVGETAKQKEKEQFEKKEKPSPVPTFTFDTLPNRKMVFNNAKDAP